MPTITSQRHAWRWAAFRAIEPTALVMYLAMALTLTPAHTDEGDIIVQHNTTSRTTYRGVQTDVLPVRTAVSSFPAQAFNQSVGSVVSVLSDGELGTSCTASDNAATGLQRTLTSSAGTGLQPITDEFSVGNAVSSATVGGVGGQVIQATVDITSQIDDALASLSYDGQP